MRNGQKVGWIETYRIFNHDGKKLGYFDGDSVHGADGRKIGYINGSYLYDESGSSAKVSLDKINDSVEGGMLTEIGKCAVFMLIGI